MDQFLLIPIESEIVFRGSTPGRDIADFDVPLEQARVQAHELGYLMHEFDLRPLLTLRTPVSTMWLVL